jgi:hypothetical protein
VQIAVALVWTTAMDDTDNMTPPKAKRASMTNNGWRNVRLFVVSLKRGFRD